VAKSPQGSEINPLLRRLGERVRDHRTSDAMTLRELSERASVSQRFLVSLEAGKANVSVLRLDAIARALGTSAAALLREPLGATPEHAPLQGRIVALLGLRGAGKSTIGQRAAQRLGLPFVELDATTAGSKLPRSKS
jgi:XRE family aerobic/anaerobic benzoate catabolism transcriptional regulator